MPTTVHIPPVLLKSVDRRAKALGVSRNGLIVRALEQAVRVRDAWAPIQTSARPVTHIALARDATLVTVDLDRMTRVPGLRVEDWNA